MQSKTEIESRAAIAKHGLRPIAEPFGDCHHTELSFKPEDREVGELAYWLGDLFADKQCDPEKPHKDSYFYNEMSSQDIWTRVARALRIHGLKIVNVTPIKIGCQARHPTMNN